jgi:hypothetical protein
VKRKYFKCELCGKRYSVILSKCDLMRFTFADGSHEVCYNPPNIGCRKCTNLLKKLGYRKFIEQLEKKNED